eukprot:4028264-Prymnesium_polylepis.1
MKKRAALPLPAEEEKPRRNAVPVKAKPVLACESQEWLYFKSQTAAKRLCFGKRGLKLNTGITYALKHNIGPVLGWHFSHALVDNTSAIPHDPPSPPRATPHTDMRTHTETRTRLATPTTVSSSSASDLNYRSEIMLCCDGEDST